ncbi:hypothetical protein Bhyg_15482 [Pseudolycoriella hygida]|uniref:Uncharacterized protein n=1 Tax=Pseudolycoriella hygida TaxID=35572 RepID=A0A9Q0RTP0_9DIPT|nr:hypothetical protein Bhyg_15482 [Pseudolycoriella hygida]
MGRFITFEAKHLGQKITFSEYHTLSSELCLDVDKQHEVKQEKAKSYYDIGAKQRNSFAINEKVLFLNNNRWQHGIIIQVCNAPRSYGSVLGPHLFSFHISDLPNHLSNTAYHMFADNVQLYLSYSLDGLDEAVQCMNEDLVSIASTCAMLWTFSVPNHWDVAFDSAIIWIINTCLTDKQGFPLFFNPRLRLKLESNSDSNVYTGIDLIVHLLEVTELLVIVYHRIEQVFERDPLLVVSREFSNGKLGSAKDEDGPYIASTCAMLWTFSVPNHWDVAFDSAIIWIINTCLTDKQGFPLFFNPRLRLKLESNSDSNVYTGIDLNWPSQRYKTKIVKSENLIGHMQPKLKRTVLQNWLKRITALKRVSNKINADLLKVKLWEKIMSILNSLGPKKSVASWKRCLSSLRDVTKKKLTVARNRPQSKVHGKIDAQINLRDQKIVKIFGIDILDGCGQLKEVGYESTPKFKTKKKLPTKPTEMICNEPDYMFQHISSSTNSTFTSTATLATSVTLNPPHDVHSTFMVDRRHLNNSCASSHPFPSGQNLSEPPTASQNNTQVAGLNSDTNNIPSTSNQPLQATVSISQSKIAESVNGSTVNIHHEEVQLDPNTSEPQRSRPQIIKKSNSRRQALYISIQQIVTSCRKHPSPLVVDMTQTHKSLMLPGLVYISTPNSLAASSGDDLKSRSKVSGLLTSSNLPMNSVDSLIDSSTDKSEALGSGTSSIEFNGLLAIDWEALAISLRLANGE